MVSQVENVAKWMPYLPCFQVKQEELLDIYIRCCFHIDILHIMSCKVSSYDDST
jgi:hypothetical protein